MNGNRKFTFSLICVGLMAAMVFTGHMNGVEFWQGMGAVSVAFGLGNAGEHIGKGISKKNGHG